MRRILVVDDDFAMIHLYKMHLKREGYDGSYFSSGLAACEKLEELDPELAILDYSLPDIKGQQIVQSIREIPTLRNIPIIMVTGQGKSSIKDALLAEGVSEVFSKPFSPKLLMRKVAELIE